MSNELWIAGAGSGKTNKIITDAIEIINSGGRVLVVTYTTNNQAELRARFEKIYGASSDKFIVKGLFSFYLDDLVRPYQNFVFPDRIITISHTETNPHLIPGTTYYIEGRAELLKDGSVNPLHYLTPCKTKAYSGLLAKLATLIAKKSKNAPAKRLNGIYQKIFFDEVQDLVGWDYDVIKSLNKIMPSAICCVGDFRQTIYTTTFGQKSPLTQAAKIEHFTTKLKFTKNSMSNNRRCIQSICDLADLIHFGQYEKTTSDVTSIPPQFSHHTGIFVVKRSQLQQYLETFRPHILRWSSKVGVSYLPSNVSCSTFGSSKGLGFDRVLLIPTDKHLKFICGNVKIFDNEKTDEAQNKLYVAITRARYSLSFVVEDKIAQEVPYRLWTGAD